MFLSINLFSITLLISGVVSMLVSFFVFTRVTGSIRWFSHMMFCISLWAVTYGLELASTTLESMMFWIQIEYVGITLLPATWICFIVSFTGKHKWMTRRNLALVFSMPVITMIIVWTNSWHHLYYQSVSLAHSDSYILLALERGPWYYVFTAYFYLLLASGTILLLQRFKHADPIYRRQNAIILLAAFIPWLVNLLYLVGLRPHKHIDLTPYAFIVTSSLLAVGLLRFRLLNLIPIARDKIIEEMKTGMMVLDAQDIVIELNVEMRRILGRHASLIGEAFGSFLAGEVELNQKVAARINSSVVLRINDRWYEVGVTSMFEKMTVYSGVILLFSDITSHRLTEQQLAD